MAGIAQRPGPLGGLTYRKAGASPFVASQSARSRTGQVRDDLHIQKTAHTRSF